MLWMEPQYEMSDVRWILSHWGASLRDYIPTYLLSLKLAKLRRQDTEGEGVISRTLNAFTEHRSFDEYILIFIKNFPLDTTHKQQQTWNCKHWRAIHCFQITAAFFPKPCCCHFHLLWDLVCINLLEAITPLASFSLLERLPIIVLQTNVKS